MGEEGLPWLGCGAPRLVLPALAYWYDGGRPSGWLGFMAASDVDEAAAAALAGGVGVELGWGGCWEWAEVVLAAETLVPLVEGGAAVEVGGLRLVEEEFWVLVDWLLVLRVEPTSLRKREFIDVDDMEDPCVAATAGGRQVGRSGGVRQAGWRAGARGSRCGRLR